MYFLFLIVLIILTLWFINKSRLFENENTIPKIKDAKNKIEKLKLKEGFNKSFNKIPKYYINLDRSKNRVTNIEKEIKKYNIENIERIKAFDGRKISNINKGKIEDYSYTNKSFWSCTKSELAITMSHILAIKTAEEKGYENAIIMEDDIEFYLLPYWDIDFDKVIKDLPKDCDILLLAHHHHHNDYKIISKKEKDVKVSGVCYLITKSGMNKISKYLKNKHFSFNSRLRGLVWDTNIMRNLNIYHTNKSLFLLFNFKFNTEKDGIKENFFCGDSYLLLKEYYKKLNF